MINNESMIKIKQHKINEILAYKNLLSSLLKDAKILDTVDTDYQEILNLDKINLIKVQVNALDNLLDSIVNNKISLAIANREYIAIRQNIITNVLNLEYFLHEKPISQEYEWLYDEKHTTKINETLEINEKTFNQFIERKSINKSIANIFFRSLDEDDLIKELQKTDKHTELNNISFNGLQIIYSCGDKKTLILLLEILRYNENLLPLLFHTGIVSTNLIDNFFSDGNLDLIKATIKIILNFDKEEKSQKHIDMIFKLAASFNTMEKIRSLILMMAKNITKRSEIAINDEALFGHFKCFDILFENPKISEKLSEILSGHITEEEQFNMYTHAFRNLGYKANILHTFITNKEYDFFACKILVSLLPKKMLLRLCEQLDTKNFNVIANAIMHKSEIAVQIINRFMSDPSFQDVLTFNKFNKLPALERAESENYYNKEVINAITNYFQSIALENALSVSQERSLELVQSKPNDALIIETKTENFDIMWNDLREKPVAWNKVSQNEYEVIMEDDRMFSLIEVDNTWTLSVKPSKNEEWIELQKLQDLASFANWEFNERSYSSLFKK